MVGTSSASSASVSSTGRFRFFRLCDSEADTTIAASKGVSFAAGIARRSSASRKRSSPVAFGTSTT